MCKRAETEQMISISHCPQQRGLPGELQRQQGSPLPGERYHCSWDSGGLCSSSTDTPYTAWHLAGALHMVPLILVKGSFPSKLTYPKSDSWCAAKLESNPCILLPLLAIQGNSGHLREGG